jgi:acyl dehydratase
MTLHPPAPYRVVAFNTARESDNRIHDDTVAARYGFAGGLVPGVDVYAYLTHPLVAHWGEDWLARGTAECRFERPVYDGDLVEVSLAADRDALAITVESRGMICAHGRATLPAAAPPAPAPQAPIAVARERPPADETSLAPGTCLGMVPLTVTAADADTYLRDVRETLPLYAAAGLVHPGTLLRTCNWVIKQNVVLGPWIHVASRVQHLGHARVGDVLSARAEVLRNYVRKGHKFAELDVVVSRNEQVPVARVHHTVIYQPRERTP